MVSKFVGIVLVLARIGECSSQHDITCPREWKRHNDGCYLLVNYPHVSSLDAEQACNRIQNGSHLVSISSEDEKNLTSTLMLTGGVNNTEIGAIWIGLMRNDEPQKCENNTGMVDTCIQENREGWAWTDGTPLGVYESWHPSQPNGDSRCVRMVAGPHGWWRDFPCDRNLSYVCEVGTRKINHYGDRKDHQRIIGSAVAVAVLVSIITVAMVLGIVAWRRGWLARCHGALLVKCRKENHLDEGHEEDNSGDLAEKPSSPMPSITVNNAAHSGNYGGIVGLYSEDGAPGDSINNNKEDSSMVVQPKISPSLTNAMPASTTIVPAHDCRNSPGNATTEAALNDSDHIMNDVADVYAVPLKKTLPIPEVLLVENKIYES